MKKSGYYSEYGDGAGSDQGSERTEVEGTRRREDVGEMREDGAIEKRIKKR